MRPAQKHELRSLQERYFLPTGATDNAYFSRNTHLDRCAVTSTPGDVPQAAREGCYWITSPTAFSFNLAASDSEGGDESSRLRLPKENVSGEPKAAWGIE